MIPLFREQLRNEIKSWTDDKIISDDQAQQLYQRYSLDGQAPWYMRSSFMLSALAIVLVAMGLFLLISFNWEHFNIPLRASFGLLPLAIAYVIGFMGEWRNRSEQAELAFFFGSLALGLNIYLQAQIFHIEAYYPNGVLWWALGSLPFAWYYRSNLHNFLVMGLFIIWLPMNWEHDHFSWYALLFIIPSLYVLYLKPNGFQLVVAQVALIMMFMNFGFWLEEFDDFDFLLQLLASALVSVLLTDFVKHQYSIRFIGFLRMVLSFGILCILFSVTYSGVAREIAQTEVNIFTIVLLAVGGVMLFLHDKTATMIWNLGILTFLIVISFIKIKDDSQYVTGDVPALLANVLFLVYAVWNIWSGLRNRIKYNFMLGICLVLVLALSRYMDLFSDYIVSSFIFMASGVGIYLLNNYWNKRIKS